MSHYAGLDISMKETTIAIVDEKGKFVFESVCETSPEEITQTLKNSGFILEKIGLECGNLSFWLMDELKQLGVSAICIESKQMATLIALKINKTDKNDARLIANAMRCNLYKEVYHKTKESVEIGILMGSRRTLVETRTRLKNSVRGFIKAYGIRLGTVSHQKFSQSVRSSIEGCEKIVQISIESLIKTYEEVGKNIEIIEKELEIISKKEALILLLESTPGVGTITALTFKAVIGDPYRFKNPRDVGAYLGLTPKQYSSGDTTKQGSISKCGCKELRALLVECAVVILTRTTRWSKLKAWGLKILRRSGTKKAAAAVARKLAVILLKMWQEGKGFIYGEKIKKIKDTEEVCMAV